MPKSLKNGDSISNRNSSSGGVSVVISKPQSEIIVAIPSELSEQIIKNRGWLFPIDPRFSSKIIKS